MSMDDLRRRLPEQMLPALIEAASIDEEASLEQLRRRGLPATRVEDLRRLDADLLDTVAADLIRRARRVSAVSGVGSGMAGWMAVAPDVTQQLVTLLRLGQRLSLLYGFEFRTPEGQALLWEALARATGVRLDPRGLPALASPEPGGGLLAGVSSSSPLVRTLALAVVRRLARRISTPVGRLVPVLGGGIGGWSNYVEIGRAGHRMMAYYRARRTLAMDRADEGIEVDVVG